MYEIAILFHKQIPEVELLKIQQCLKNYHFISTIIEEPTCRVLLLYQTSDELIEQTVSSLHIELPKYSKKSQVQDVEWECLSNNKKHEKYRNFIKIREFLDPQIKETEKYSKFKYKDRVKFCNNGDSQVELDMHIRQIAVYQILATIPNDYDITYDDTQKFLLVSMRQKGRILDLCPLRNFRHSTFKELQKSFNQKMESLDSLIVRIRSQMGEQLAFYFAFLLYLIKHMFILVVLGIITYLLDEYFKFDVTTSPFEPLYAALAILWGAYFIGHWIIKQQEYAVKWRSHGKNFDFMEQKIEQSLLKCLTHKDHFEIEEHVKQIKYANEIDPITGQKVQIKSNLIKIYLNSILKTAPYVIALITFLITSLNVRGYVEKNTLLYFSQLQLENNKSVSMSYLLAILHVVIVNILNKKYKSVSIATSLQEDHKSFQTYERSLIIKRFAFEIFSAFFDFFYIGFVLGDIIRLKQEMVQMFMVDEARRIMTETILPSISKLKLIRQQSQIVQLLSHQQTKQIQEQFSIGEAQMKAELKSQLISCFLPKYESFDDYLEIILNFGYVCFFTSAFRMAGIVVTLFLLLEFFSDYYKVYHLYQKPFSIKTKSIGPWTRAMDIICVISVFTNLMLFSVASDQIVKFFPTFFVQNTQPMISQSQFDEIEDQQIKIIAQTCGLLSAAPAPEKEGQAALIVVVIEHVLLLLMFLIRKLINLRQNWCEIYLKRQQYKKTIK